MKKLVFTFAFFSLFSLLHAFEWPKKNINSENITSYFGQNISQTISTSILISETESVMTSENGKLLLIYNDFDDDSDFFPSTYGAAVIIEHEDNLISVYGNLEKKSIKLNEDNLTANLSDEIAMTGHSGYQKNDKTLEFQIIDTKEHKAINPKLLLPQNIQEVPLTLSGLILKNKNNTYYDLSIYKNFSSGIYKIYKKRDSVSVPYYSAILANGEIKDYITLDTIVEENNNSIVTGSIKYDTESFYPDEKLILLGEVTLSPGKTTLTIQIADIKNVIKQQLYNITVY